MVTLGTLAAMVLALGGCAEADDIVFTAFTGEAPKPATVLAREERLKGLGVPPPALGDAVFQPTRVSAGRRTGTEAGRATAQLRLAVLEAQNEIGGLDQVYQDARRALAGHTDAYLGATRAAGYGPEAEDAPPDAIAEQAPRARSALARMSAELLKMNGLAPRITAAVTEAEALSAGAEAIAERDDASPDDRAQLATLQETIAATVGTGQAFLEELRADVGTYNAYVRDQRALLDLATGAPSAAAIVDARTSRR